MTKLEYMRQPYFSVAVLPHDYRTLTMEDRQQLSLSVLHGGTTHAIQLLENATVEDLRHQLEQLTGVPPASQKIISKGKALPNGAASAEVTLASLIVSNGSKLSMIGSPASASQAVRSEFTALQQRLTASSSRQTVQARKTGAMGKTVMGMNDVASSNAFNNVEVLTGCPHESLRKDRLDKLTKDEAVLGKLRRSRCVDQSDFSQTV